MPKIKDRTGETNIAINGQKMTIVKYNRAIDIDIQFEDGTIVKHKCYKCFISGEIANPNCSNNITRIGETILANNGQKMTIIKYRNCNDIDVQFEDGTVVEHKRYNSFIKGYNLKKDIEPIVIRIGETILANNGQKMTIIKYNSCNDIDVRFEDGTVVEHKRYNSFIKGQIANPNYDPRIRVDRVGETNIANNGQKMTIIKYHRIRDIDVQFEDGTIVEHKYYQSFITGDIHNPNYRDPRIRTDRVGETNTSKNGQKMTIIKYRSNNDIDIQFEDGTIVEHKTYYYFNKGILTNPNYNNKITRVGKTNIAKNGQKMTIIKYRNHNDIDIQFEDGYISKNKRYSCFISGDISNPNCSNNITRIGETILAKNGQKMTIIKYRSYNDIDIQFEDGTVVEHKSYKGFIKSMIGHKLPYQMDNIIIEKLAYINNIGNFFCYCTKCGKRDIMTISEAKNHQCSESMTG